MSFFPQKLGFWGYQVKKSLLPTPIHTFFQGIDRKNQGILELCNSTLSKMDAS